MYRELPHTLPGTVAWSVTDAGVDGTLVLPDGCMDLIWHDGGLLVAGPDTRAHRTTAAGPRAIGLRFAPGLGPAVLGVPANSLRDTRITLSDLWPDTAVRRLAVAAEADPFGALVAEVRRRLDPADLPTCRSRRRSRRVSPPGPRSARSQPNSAGARAPCIGNRWPRTDTGPRPSPASCGSTGRWSPRGRGHPSRGWRPTPATPTRRTWPATCGLSPGNG